MLLKKIHHLKKKIKSHISNIDLLEIVIEDNSSIRSEINDLKTSLEEKDKERKVLHKCSSALEKLNIAYSKDILLLSQAITEQYELLSSIVNKDFLHYSDDLFDFDSDCKKKKKKIVH